MTVITNVYSLEQVRASARTDAASGCVRQDLRVIINLVPAGTKVLDLGCGDGTLLSELLKRKAVFARGVEVNEASVRACIARGLSVRHGDIEEGLADFRDHAIDFVLLSQTIAYLDQPLRVLSEMLRVGRFAVISMENAGYWRRRAQAVAGQGAGSTLASGQPVIRSITLGQFEKALKQLGLKAARRCLVGALGWVWPSLLADTAVYLVTKGEFTKQ